MRYVKKYLNHSWKLGGNGSNPLGRLGRPLRGPQAGINTLIVIVALYFTLFLNNAFFAEVVEKSGVEGVARALLVASTAALLTAMNVLILGLLCVRWTLKPIVALLLIVSAAAAYNSDNYGVFFDSSMIRNVLKTDSAEAGELLTWGLFLSVLVKGLLPAVAVCAVRIRPRCTMARGLLSRALLLGMAMVVVVGAALASFDNLSSLMRNHKSVRYLATPGNYLASIGKVIKEETRAERGPIKVVGPDATMDPHPPGAKPHFLVIVVGETVRAQNWGLNGYARNTTPQLEALDVVNFTDVTACGSNTEVSVPCMFSMYGRRDYDRDKIKRSESLLHVLERAGIKTLWRDNQTGCKGVCSDLAFESYRVPAKDSLCDDQACRDEIMLQGLHDSIDDNPGDVVVVLHQLGNHGPSYYKRYPESLRKFTPDCRNADLGKCTRAEIVNAYDNAVLATDDFLAKTIRMLEQDKSHDTGLIYVSDHGESLGEANVYLHGLPYAIAPETQIKVPMVMWMSEGMKSSNKLDIECVQGRSRLPATHDNLFHSVLGLMQVRTKALDQSLNLFSGCSVGSVAAP
ncbi:phosphoethanolamine transferase [Stenotrophomonas acidaminiphila]|uniref:phosphoethanolamine transferase n=1 Tax=Stenotrophomonas acidaminiphila TaxID=128780 RepID=UPI0028AA9FC6|nr:phosphoethanolamine--lipid A transferase [Stenotrophomonas acidaminiphila]